MARLKPAPKRGAKNAPSARAAKASAKFNTLSPAAKKASNAKANAFASKLAAGRIGPGTGSNSSTGGAG